MPRARDLSKVSGVLTFTIVRPLSLTRFKVALDTRGRSTSAPREEIRCGDLDAAFQMAEVIGDDCRDRPRTLKSSGRWWERGSARAARSAAQEEA